MHPLQDEKVMLWGFTLHLEPLQSVQSQNWEVVFTGILAANLSLAIYIRLSDNKISYLCNQNNFLELLNILLFCINNWTKINL